jgi:hypothetical protein
MEQAVVWFYFNGVVNGGQLLALAVFLLGMCCGHWLGRNRDSARARRVGQGNQRAGLTTNCQAGVKRSNSATP